MASQFSLDEAAVHIVDVGLANASDDPLGWGMASTAHTMCTTLYNVDVR